MRTVYLALIIAAIIVVSVRIALRLGERDRVDWFPNHSRIPEQTR